MTDHHFSSHPRPCGHPSKGHLVKKSILLLAGFLFLSLTPLSAQSSVWEVTDGENKLYLGGTVHILRKSDFPLPDEFEQAYTDSDALVFEVAPSDLKDPSLAVKMLTLSTYKDGRTMKSVLSEEAYPTLEAYCEKANIPLEAFRHYKPGAFLMFISLHEYTKLGFTDEGVETFFEPRATKDGKSISALETAEFQINLLTEMGEGFEDDFILYSIKDMEKIGEMAEDMVSAWREGSLQALEDLMVDSMKELPEVYDAFLKDRNIDWIPKIEALLKTDPVEFILVGAAHLPGKNGVIPLLKEKGYTVKQLELK